PNLRNGAVPIPAGFPPMDIPADNALTDARIDLGKRLFFDPVLSRDRTISCSSCHLQEKGFADVGTLSTGIDDREGQRNASALINLGWNTRFFRDGGVPTLELQVLAPISDHNEMDFTIAEVAARLKEDPTYVRDAQIAYGRAPDPFVITRAIAAYERSLVSGNSPYDRFTFQDQSDALSASEIRGRDLFFADRTRCATCHSGFNFTHNGFENNGLYAQYADSGRTRVTLDPADRGKFKVPTLRNVGVTGPYMHDGSLSSLEAVIAHYESGGMGHPNQSENVQGFTLSAEEKEDLINFLHALTDSDFLNDPQHQPE
ncbi:MAG: cytochrome c peroxidase, partial [Bacteroidota bacterium]